jgi:hypothetical protein
MNYQLFFGVLREEYISGMVAIKKVGYEAVDWNHVAQNRDF